MNIVFYLAAAIAVIASLLVITRVNIVHSLLNLVVSLLAVSLIFFLLGAPFVAALEVIVYAGAIMVLFVFVIMMLSVGPATYAQERTWLARGVWFAPAILALALLGLQGYALMRAPTAMAAGGGIPPKTLSLALFGSYLPVVEMASILLLAGLVGAFHLTRRSAADKDGGTGP